MAYQIWNSGKGIQEYEYLDGRRAWKVFGSL